MGGFFIRNVAACDLSALMEYRGLSVAEAGKTMIGKAAAAGGDGGLIALDQNGNAAMPFSTPGMYRGAITREGTIEIYIYNQ